MSIGEAVKIARQNKGLTQKQLAEMLYVDPSLVCRYEKGQREIPLVTLVTMSDILEIDIDKLRKT